MIAAIALAAVEAGIVVAAAVCVFWAATATPGPWETVRLAAMCVAITAAVNVVAALSKRRDEGETDE